MVDDINETPEQEPEEQIEKPPVQVPEAIASITRAPDDDQSSVPLWLITFTDTMALMLTFFVLLYAMSSPQEEKWIEISAGLTNRFKVADPAPYKSSTQDSISIDKIQKNKALKLDYVKTLVANLLKEKSIEGVILIENGERLIISLPSELLFRSAQAEIGLEGKTIIFELAGVLARLKNRVEVVGHSDPRPINANAQGIYKSNWELSLGRAAAVANMLRNVGYMNNITVRGVSSARYDELPDTITEDKRNDLSRRVDIIVMDDDGHRKNAFDTR